MKTKTLIIVDCQTDFINPKGSLYVPGAEQAEQAIYNFIEYNLSNISDVIFTIDWHTPEHCSFQINGGEWPEHCIQYSEGAGISNKLIEACYRYNIPYKIFKKGSVNNLEEYGAFSYMNVKYYKNDAKQIYFLGESDNNSGVPSNTTNFIVCGLAGDYCVKETIKNLLHHQKNNKSINIEVFKDGIASIDKGKTLDDFIDTHFLKTI